MPFFVEEEPDRVAVTREVADLLAAVFNGLVARGEERGRAQRFVLQCIVAMFAQSGLFTELVDECRTGKKSTYDRLGSLFRQRGDPCFSGGLFSRVAPVELNSDELTLLARACAQDWSKVEPSIFGTLFQRSMGEPRRHALGAHFTSEAEIHKVVTPTIVRPWRERFAAARSVEELLQAGRALRAFRVLDPACGNGNFLYVAYRELKRLEAELNARMDQEYGMPAGRMTVGVHQLHGIDRDRFAVELAKVALRIAKEALGDLVDRDNLDDNIRWDDALFCAWPRVDVIIGNPPYQSKNKAQAQYGRAYMNKVRKAYPEVPGQADYCVYWFRRAHDELPEGGRAGLVGTNTIRENKSRIGGLDYIVANGGTITEAVSTQVWPGDAVVHVSIVNWTKGEADGMKTLHVQRGDHVDAAWDKIALPFINAALSPHVDVTAAEDLATNLRPKTTFQGQTPGHTQGFVIARPLAEQWIAADAANAEVLFKYLVGDDLLDNPSSSSDRMLLDFGDRDVLSASRREEPFEHVKRLVLEARSDAVEREARRNAEARADDPKARVNRHHASFLKRWWRLSFRRDDMLEALAKLNRYIACSRVTRRPIFELVAADIRPGDALQVFALEDDYSFGILQSDLHWQWFKERCSGLKIDPRYTSASVYSTYPWPQAPTLAQARAVAAAGKELRALRRATLKTQGIGLRALYRLLERKDPHPLKEAHRKLDDAVRAAYAMKARDEPLAFLLGLNRALAIRQAKGQSVVGPGMPPGVDARSSLISKDCVSF